jgi:hypothetical protein
VRHIFVPELLVAYSLTAKELPSASPAFVYLNPVLVPVLLYFRASAENAFFLFIDFDLCLCPANIGIPKDFRLTVVHYIE